MLLYSILKKILFLKYLKAKPSQLWFAPPQFAVCPSVCERPFTCTWNVRTTEYFLRRSLTFCVESVEQYFSLICIAITMEWRRVQTSKILFYLRTVTCRDAPIQIKYNNRTKFPLSGSHMAKLNRHTEEFPVTNMSYISIILSSDNKVMVEL